MRNKYLLILFLLAGFLGWSQQYSYVKVDDTYTPEKLIKEVLVRSSCDLVSNVRYQYGSGVPASTAIMAAGYFQKNNSDFPYEDGIVLATDKSSFVPGPISNGKSSPNQFRWGGDKDLNDLITDAGGFPTQPIPVSDMRSTVIDFDFIPVKSTVNFEYIFGSNSYGGGCNYDCGNGALFGAWLIDTTTGVGQNLAKVPTTNLPISIATVRDGNKTYPVNCAPGNPASNNPAFFGNAYGNAANQLPALSAPVDLKGLTIPMQSLTANVIVGRKYKIKLAIIDFCPSPSHTSAVFFKAGSFDIGNLNLGDPVLIGEGNGLCVGDSYTLKSGMDSNLFTFEWYKDGVLIPGQTGPDLVVTETGDYSVKASIPNVAGCVLEAAPVRVEFFEYVKISPPKDIDLCPNAGTTTRFHLMDAVAGVTTNPNILYDFFLTKSDADNNVNKIGNFYDLPNSTTTGRTIWVRAYIANNPCPYVTSFKLGFLNCNLQLNVLPNLSLCEGDAVQTFDLNVQTPLVFNNASGYTVSYHLSNSDATTNQGAIPVGNLATYNGTHGQRIWVRVTSTSNPLIFGVTSFYLYKYRLPQIQSTILPLTACEKGNTGLADFNLNLAYNIIPSSPVGISLEFYEFQQDALLGNTALMLPANYTGAAGTIYVRVRNLDGDCFRVVPLDLQIISTPTANAVGPITYCDLNNDGFGEFNLDPYKIQITGNPMPANMVVTYHETQGDADANVRAIQNTGTYRNKVANQQTIYARVGYTNSSCYTTIAIILKVNKTPAITPIGKMEACDLNNDGVEVFNLKSREADILKGLNATSYTVTYHITAGAAMSGTGAIGNPTSFSSSVSKVVYVRVTDNVTGCFAVTRVDLDVVSIPVVANPLPTSYECDGDGNGFEIFDLASLIPGIVGTQQGLGVTFHYTNADAQSGINPLPLQYQNGVKNVQTIYVRVFNQSVGCYVVTTLKLEVRANPVLNIPSDPYVICSASGYGTINIFLYGKALVDATGENYGFKFYETQSDAMNDVGMIANPVAYNNLKPSNPVVWIRVEDPQTGCFSVYPISFQLVVPPKLPSSLPDLEECDVLGNRQDQSTLFDLTKQNAALLAAQSGQGTYLIRYFTTEALALSNTNWIVAPTQYQNVTNPQRIWVRIEDTSKPGSCGSVMSFRIHVNAPMVLNQPLPLVFCDTSLPNDGKMAFDLTVRERDILGGQPFQTTVTYHLTQQDAERGIGNIGTPTQFYNTVNPQTVYVSVENQYGCRSVVTLTLRVLPLPEPNLKPTPLELCETAAGSAQATFNLRLAESNLSNGASYIYSYFGDQLGAEANDPASLIANPDAYLSTSGTVYVRVANEFTDTATQCAVVVPLELIVNPWPKVGPMTALAACMDTPTPTTKFNLHDKDAEALAGANAANFSVVYYSSLKDAEDGINPIPYNYTNTTINQQKVWVRVQNKKTGCFNIADFDLVIEQKVYAFAPTSTDFCETDFENDGVTVVDLTVMDAEIIGTQPVTPLIVEYRRYNGASIGSFTQAQINNGEVIQAVVINRNGHCTAMTYVTVRIKPAPEVKPLVDGIICFEYRRDGELITGHYLDTGVPAGADYTFTWTRNGAPLGATDADVLDGGRRLYVKAPGTYSVTVTSRVNGCSTTRSAVVQQAPSITIDEIIMTDSFSGANGIEVVAVSDASPLEYKLDEGPWQDSNIFIDVTPGEHTVYVRAKGAISCPASKVITVMDYPKYFTPNDDGYNDSWNIWSLKNQPNAKVYIFDRYGKLIKQLSPAGAGWDGTFNGKPLPSTDYWFKAEYVDPKTGLQKEVTGHFSLKR